MRVTILIIGLILVLGAGLAWLAGSGTLAHSLRAAVVEQMSLAFGREVRVARLAGDPVRGIVLDGVRVAAPPGERGSFFEASRIVLRFRRLSLFADLLRGRGPAASLASIELHRPFLVLSRDAAGRWNLPQVPGQGTPGPAFTGTVDVREGQLVFTDAWQLPAAFAAHFERVTGTVSWEASPRLRVDVDAVNTNGRTPALLHASGTAVPDAHIVDVALTTRGASAAHWGRYLARLDWLRWTGGIVDGDVHVVLSAWGSGTAVDYRARLHLSDGRALLTPQQVPISGIEGPLELDNGRVASEGLAMTVGTSPVWVRGEIRHVAGVHLDLAVRSASVDLTMLRRLVFADAALELSGATGGEVRIVGPVGALLVEGTVTNGAGRVEGHRFTDLSTDVQYYGGLLVFDGVDAGLDGGRARGYARIALPTREFFVLASLDGVDAASAGGGLGWLPLRGAASGFVAAAGTPGAVIGHARLTVARGQVAGLAFDRAEAMLGFDRGVVEVDRVDVRRGPAVVHAAGTVTPSAVDLALVASDVNLRAFGDLTGPPQWLAGTADLNGRVTGTPSAPIVVGRLDARDGRMGPFPFDRARGPLRIGAGGLQTPGLVLRDGEGTYDAVGEVRWTHPGTVDLAVRARHIPAQRLLDIAKVPLDVAGTVEGTMRLTGTLSAPQADGTLALSDALVHGQPVDRAAAAFRWNGTALLLDDAFLEVNASRITIRGSIDQRGRLALSFAAKNLNVSDVASLRNTVVQVAGDVDLDGTLGGTVGAPTVDAALSSTSLSFNGQPIDRADGTIRYQGGRVVLSPLALTHSGGTLKVSGAVLLGDDPVVDVRATAQHARLTTLLGLARIQPPFRIDGTIDGEMAITGRVSNPGAVLTVEMADGVVGDHPIRHAAVSATIADQAIIMRSLSVTPDAGTLVGAGRIDLAGNTELELSGQGLNLDLLRPLTGIARPLAGELDFTLQLSGALADPILGLSASVNAGTAGETAFDRIVLQAFYQGGQLHVEQGLLQQDRHKIKVTGTLPLDLMQLRVNDARPVDLHLSLVDADLSLLTALTDRIERGQGPLAGEITLTGTPAQPQLEGEVTATDGTLTVRGLEPALTDLQARLVFANNEIRVATWHARVGEGTLAVSGTVGLNRFRPDRVALRFDAAGTQLRYPPYVDGIVEGMARLDGPVGRPTISGSVALSHGDLFIPTIMATADRAEVSFDPIFDLTLSSGDELWVNVGQLRLQVHGSVQAIGTWGRPRLAGELQSDRGTFQAFNTAFSLTDGRATFSEFRGITPYIDARAETTIQVVTAPPGGVSRVEPVRVFLHVYGTPPLTVDLASDPPLTREEILADLGGRVGVTRLLRGEFEAMLQAEVGAAFFGPVGRAVAQTFGLEEFTVVYVAEQPLTLRIGKSLVRNLYVTLNSEFGVDPEYIWALEYRFTPITMLSFSVSNKGTYDLFYRFTYRF